MAQFAIVEGRRLRRKVRAIVTNPDGQFLLIRPHGYREDSWTLPGGGVEAGETTRDAVARELHEELGLPSAVTAHAVPLQIRSEFIYRPEHKAKRELDHDGQLAELFHLRVPRGTAIHRQVEEIAEFGWFSREGALAACTVPAQRELFERCLGTLGDVAEGREVA